jgi:hypothetical protein
MDGEAKHHDSDDGCGAAPDRLEHAAGDGIIKTRVIHSHQRWSGAALDGAAAARTARLNPTSNRQRHLRTNCPRTV